MKRLLAVGIILILLTGTVPVIGMGSSSNFGGSQNALTTTQNFDRVQFRIAAFENGSAKWTFHYERTLSNKSQKQQFQTYANRFNGNNTKLYLAFQKQAKSLSDAGQRSTGRQMKPENFSKEATISGLDQNVGVVQMSFVWTNFTEQSGNTLVIGDVFKGGLYLAPNQSLVVEAGNGTKFKSVDPKPDEMSKSTLSGSDSITWMNEHEFADDRPRVTLVKTADQSTGAVSTGVGSSPWMMALAGAVVLLLGLGAAVAWRQAGGLDLQSFGRGSPDGGAAVDAGASGGAGGSVQPAVSDEELLTDEARVKKLLVENGGRMKQVNIVEETGWSKSKVSMLLSDMAEEGDISKLRVGRENIISLDGYEPDAARSPHEK